MADKAVIPASAELSKFLRRRLEDIGSTRPALAAALGLKERTIHRLLHGERGLRTESEVVRAARHLKVQEQDLWTFLPPPDDAEEVSTEQLLAEIRAVGARLDELFRRWGPPEAIAPALAEEEEPRSEPRRSPSGQAESRPQRASDRDRSEDRDSSQRGA